MEGLRFDVRVLSSLAIFMVEECKVTDCPSFMRVNSRRSFPIWIQWGVKRNGDYAARYSGAARRAPAKHMNKT